MKTVLIMIVGMVLIYGFGANKAGATQSPIFNPICSSSCYGAVANANDSYIIANNPYITEDQQYNSSGGPGFTYAYTSVFGGGNGASAEADLSGDYLYAVAAAPNAEFPYTCSDCSTANYASAFLNDTFYITGAHSGETLNLFLSVNYAIDGIPPVNLNFFGAEATLDGTDIVDNHGKIYNYSTGSTGITYSSEAGSSEFTMCNSGTNNCINLGNYFGTNNIELIVPLSSGSSFFEFVAGISTGNGGLFDPSIYVDLPQGVSVISASGINYPTYNPNNLAATPEPPTFWLMSTGLLGMFGWVGYRRIKATA